MNLKVMLGCRLFKEKENGELDILRIYKLRKRKDGEIDPSKITVKRENSNEDPFILTVDDLKEYTTLKPEAMMTINIAKLKDSETKKEVKDVIVTIAKIIDIELGFDQMPFAICRQNITDIFYNLLSKDESNMMVGLAVNKNNCPSNFDYRMLLACDDFEYTTMISYYRTDTLEDLFKFIPTLKYDDVLYESFKAHMKSVGIPLSLGKTHDKGWCKNLKTLLTENGFQADMNEMFGISDVDFCMDDYLKEKQLPNGEKYTSVIDDLKYWLSNIYKVNINDITALEFDHDINLGDFNNARYFFIRDNTKKLYMMVFTEEGEYYEADLEAKVNQSDFSTNFRMNFYSKYNQINKSLK